MGASTIAILAAILAIGVALAGLILRQGLRLDARIEQTNERIEQVEARIGERIERVEQGQADLRERMAKLEGLLEGLREAIAGRRAA